MYAPTFSSSRRQCNMDDGALTRTVDSFHSQIEHDIEELCDQNEIVIFSSTNCSTCRKTELFLKDNISSDVKVYDINTMVLVQPLVKVLQSMTRQKSFPFVFITGGFFGGYQDIRKMHDSGILKNFLERRRIRFQAQKGQEEKVSTSCGDNERISKTADGSSIESNTLFTAVSAETAQTYSVIHRINLAQKPHISFPPEKKWYSHDPVFVCTIFLALFALIPSWIIIFMKLRH